MNLHRLRWQLADILSWLACKLRGHRWYMADTWHGVPGNRAAELGERIREDFILRIDWQTEKDAFERVESEIEELAQMAGENWGHVYPKTKTLKTN